MRMLLTDEQSAALTRGLRGCSKAQRKAIREYIDLLAIEWAMVENVFCGHATIEGMDEEGQLLFKLTRAGGKYVEEELLHLNERKETQ